MLSALTKQAELKDIYCILLFKNYLEQWGWWFQRAKLVSRPEWNHFRQKDFNRCSFVRIRGLSLFLDQLWCASPWGYLHKTSDIPMTRGGYCASNDCETQEIKGHREHEHTCCENVPSAWTHEREIYWPRAQKKKSITDTVPWLRVTCITSFNLYKLPPHHQLLESTLSFKGRLLQKKNFFFQQF